MSIDNRPDTMPFSVKTSNQELSLAARFERLDVLLAEYDWLWRPQPFKQARPSWCTILPELTGVLLAMTDEEVAELSGSSMELIQLIASHLPVLSELEALCHLPECLPVELGELGPHFGWAIPGRKRDQIEAFAGAVGPVRAPLVEWCGGKGHLGRLFAAQWATPVNTLEWDVGLCVEGQRLAKRAGVEQEFTVTDVFTPAAIDHLTDRHAVALHACGELHRTLVRRAIKAGVPALDIAPCCYSHGAEEDYQALTSSTRLSVTRDDMRLAVTETVTSAPREVRRRDKEMAWKLGYDLIRRKVTGQDYYLPMKPIEKRWLKLEFADFCQTLAMRESVKLPDALDWKRYEARGWERQRETMRLSLVRYAFRRPLELWLVLDLANHLVEQGYSVSIGTFCDRKITPRNIMISARLGTSC